jgi:hypothetical protein
MNAPRILKGTIIAITAAALLAVFVPGSAYAQGYGIPLPGMSGNGFLPGVPVPNLNDPRTANFVGSFLGSFLGTMVMNNQYQDQDRHYYDGNRDRDRYRDRDNDNRHYKPRDRGYYDQGYHGGLHREYSHDYR